MENGNGVPARPVRARIAATLLALALGVPAAAAAQEVKAPAPADCVGLVLGGGGARGAAHVGVLKVLERERIPVCAVAGCAPARKLAAATTASPSDRFDRYIVLSSRCAVELHLLVQPARATSCENCARL